MLRKESTHSPDSLKQNITLLLLRDLFHLELFVSVHLVLFVALIALLTSIFSAEGPLLEGFWAIKIFLFPIGLFLVYWEKRIGVQRVHQTLPLYKEILTKSIWLSGVAFIPSLFFFFCLIFSLPVILVMDISIASFLSIILNTFLLSFTTMGISATIIHAINYDFSDLFQAPYKLLWTLAGAAVVPILVLYPNHGITLLWHILVLMICSITLVVSYKSRNHLLGDTASTKTTKEDVPPSYYRSSLSFWCVLLLRQLGMIVLGLLVCTVFYAILLLLDREQGHLENIESLMYRLFLVWLPPALSLSWVSEIRPYRALPMTLGKLIIFLYSIPVMNSLFAALLAISVFFVAGIYESLWQILAGTCLSLGISSILFNSRFTPDDSLMVKGLFVFSMLYTLDDWPYIKMYFFPAIGLVLSLLTIYMIKNTSDVYHRRTSPLRGGAFFGRR